MADVMTSASNLTAWGTADTIVQGSNRQAMTLLRGKRVRGWMAVLLPILLLRALIPVGFMPMVGADHSVRLVICDSYAPVPTSMIDMGMEGDMDMSQPSGADGRGGPPVHQRGGCGGAACARREGPCRGNTCGFHGKTVSATAAREKSNLGIPVGDSHPVS